jgi:Apea-like HEPN
MAELGVLPASAQSPLFVVIDWQSTNVCNPGPMTDNSVQSIVTLLTSASSQIVPARGRKPWVYGWAFSEYRHSDRAALQGRSGVVTFSDSGIAALEKAATRLLKEQKIRDRWEAEPFWGMLASAIVAASELTDAEDYINSYLSEIRTVGPTLTIQLIANATWDREPMSLGNVVIGDANMSFIEYVNAHAKKRTTVEHETAEKWLAKDVQPRMAYGRHTPVPAMACWTIGQRDLARGESQRQLRNVVDLTVLLEHDLKSHGVYHRGDTNRPGIRGIALDRGAIEEGLLAPAKIELGSSPLIVSPRGPERGLSWFSAEPLPLGAMLSQAYLSEAVESSLHIDPISNRIRVAARWFSDAHYTLDNDDAALALGVALDALLCGQRPLPGSAMADRFALLAPDPKQRRALVTEYLKFYGVRSSVAHGSQSSKLDEPDFIDEYRASVHWAAWRSLALRDEFRISAEKDIDLVYDDLRLGTRAWEGLDEAVPSQPAESKDEIRPHGVTAPTSDWVARPG